MGFLMDEVQYSVSSACSTLYKTLHLCCYVCALMYVYTLDDVSRTLNSVMSALTVK